MLGILALLVISGLGCSAVNGAPTLAPTRTRPAANANRKRTLRPTASLADISPNTPLTHGPVVGAVTDTTARVFARTNTASRVQIRYGIQADLSDAQSSAIQTTDASTDFTTIIPLTGLAPSTTYYLDVRVNDASQLAVPYPHFKTFPPPGTSQNFSFVMLTDSSITRNRYVKTFLSADAEHPDFVILGGDFPHGRPNTLEKKEWNFKAIYSAGTSPAMSDFVKHILGQYAVAHMWDDHDYGPDNGDKTYALKQMSLQVLREYFPTYPMTEYGDWQKFSYAQGDFFLLDARSQRDSALAPNTLTKSMLDGDHLGAQGQLTWLENGLKESTARWKFVISPVPFNETSKPTDSWAAFPAERRALIDFIQKNNITGIIIISGDLHMGGIDDGTHSTFPEMVVNGTNGAGCQSTKTPGVWSQGTYDNGNQPCNGYGVITVMTNPDRVLLQVKDSDGNTRLSYTVQ